MIVILGTRYYPAPSRHAKSYKYLGVHLRKNNQYELCLLLAVYEVIRVIAHRKAPLTKTILPGYLPIRHLDVPIKGHGGPGP